MGKVTYEFDTVEDKYDIELAHNRQRMCDALDEIYSMVRNELKHGDEELSEHIESLLERIKEESWITSDWD